MNSFVANFPVFLGLNSQAANESTPRLSTNKGTNPCQSAGHNTIHLNRPFYRYGGHVEFIRFKEYHGMPRRHSLSIYARFLGKKRTSLYIFREKSDHCYIQTRHNDLFSHYNPFIGKLEEKLARKARVNTERVYRIVVVPPGHPIILLKSN